MRDRTLPPPSLPPQIKKIHYQKDDGRWATVRMRNTSWTKIKRKWEIEKKNELKIEKHGEGVKKKVH